MFIIEQVPHPISVDFSDEYVKAILAEMDRLGHYVSFEVMYAFQNV